MGWAGIDAAPAGSAPVGGKWRVGRQVQIQKNLRQENGGSQFGMDQTGIFPNPTKAGALGIFALKDWTGIGIDPVFELEVKCTPNHLHECLQSFDENMVIIFAERIAGNAGLPGRGIRSRQGIPDYLVTMAARLSHKDPWFSVPVSRQVWLCH